MRRPLWFTFATSVLVSLFFCALIVLARVAFAARSGEIAFESDRDGNWEIYLLDLQTGTTHNLTRNPADDFTPTWSPDGTQIAFVSDRDGDKQPDLFVMNADGSHLRLLGSGSGQYANPAWTADGRSLVFMHGWQQMFVMNVASRTEQRLGTGFAPRLSPDGKDVLYYADGTNYDVNSNIYLLTLSNHRVTDLTAGPTHNWDASWSPDGSRIVFASLRDGKLGIYVMNANGSDLHAISGSANDVTPSWSPDGRQIVYASGAEGSRQLYIVDADGKNVRQLTSFTGDAHAPAWQPFLP